MTGLGGPHQDQNLEQAAHVEGGGGGVKADVQGKRLLLHQLPEPGISRLMDEAAPAELLDKRHPFSLSIFAPRRKPQALAFFSAGGFVSYRGKPISLGRSFFCTL